MEIILKTIDGSAVYENGSRFKFPSLPSEITVKNGVNYQSYKIIGLGSVNIPRGINCEEISWDGYFFGAAKIGEVMIQRFTAPSLCVEILERLRNNGTPVTVMCTGVGINRDMTISEFTWIPYGGHGNFRYSITFSQWRDLRVKVLKDPNTIFVPNSSADTANDRDGAASPAIYTVVAGDTMTSICQKVYGQTMWNGNPLWRLLFYANADVIEKAAREHHCQNSDYGARIFPGTVLTIPDAQFLDENRLELIDSFLGTYPRLYAGALAALPY